MSAHYNHFKSNLRDIFFNLFEVHNIGTSVLGTPSFPSMDESGIREILSTLEQVCSSEFSKCYADTDRNPPTFDGKGTVTLPESLKQVLNAYYDGEWNKLEFPEEMGGYGLPMSVVWSAVELLSGSAPLIGFYTLGNTIARVLNSVATEEQKKRFLPGMIEKRWGGTMVLTEPEAGSDVGAGRTKAKHVGGEVYEIEGVKRFITNGDFDLPENIVHLVLARPEGAGPGTKGLSLFIVPKFWVNEDGSLGERNGVYCTNLEKKMGLKGSATCELTFGGKVPARGILVGNVHDGIRQMFMVIEQARMAIGVKSTATLSTAYLNALSFCKERVQGPDLLKAQDKTSPRVRIIEHPDVRRMLMQQKSHAEGMRALCVFTTQLKDRALMIKNSDPKKHAEYEEENDFLLPLVKGYCSEKAYDLLAVSLQCFGGSGFCQDYPIEQYIRDQKIDSLYEGTTHIQSLDFIFRKILRDNGKTLQRVLGQIKQTVESKEGGDALELERQTLARALGDAEGMFHALMGKMKDSPYHIGLQGNRVLMATSELFIGWLLVKQSAVANAKLASATGDEKSFYQGKIASSRYFCQNVLPNLTLTRKLVENSNLELMALDEACF
jgi:alkylation response protein AidB-like acyl-CoA dehydrogenase